jgi:hypothetical protein
MKKVIVSLAIVLSVSAFGQQMHSSEYCVSSVKAQSTQKCIDEDALIVKNLVAEDYAKAAVMDYKSKGMVTNGYIALQMANGGSYLKIVKQVVAMSEFIHSYRAEHPDWKADCQLDGTKDYCMPIR